MMAQPDVFSVSGLNEYVRQLLEGEPILRSVRVEGEISGYTHARSGHRYFSLKDERSLVECIMFNREAQALPFEPENGMHVTVQAMATLYAPRGGFQLRVFAMFAQGLGDLHQRFELLKKKLAAEGLFDEARKRPLPFNPTTIGIATSKAGKAVHDIIRVARRRNPRIDIVFAPCDVQGASAPQDIVRAIRLLNQQGEADVLFVGRGGDKEEELITYNEEIVARAIAASKIPVVSCVGHELDFTIADFVADVRAQTPSTAAEVAIPEVAALRQRLDAMALRLRHGLMQGQRLKRARLERLMAGSTFAQPQKTLIESRRERLNRAMLRVEWAVDTAQEKRRVRLAMAEKTLSAVDPEKVLERGYAIVRRGGRPVARAAQLRPGEDISIRMADGLVSAAVTETTEVQEKAHAEQ